MASIVVDPAEFPVASPMLFMEATVVVVEFHEQEVVTSTMLPSDMVHVAVNCCVLETLMVADEGARLTDSHTGDSTETLAKGETNVATVAVISVVPMLAV